MKKTWALLDCIRINQMFENSGKIACIHTDNAQFITDVTDALNLYANSDPMFVHQLIAQSPTVLVYVNNPTNQMAHIHNLKWRL